MSIKVFQDNIFPRHVSDLMNLMHMIVFNGTDGEEKWDTYLLLKQKEYIALGLAQYYQCEHCIQHHFRSVSKLEKLNQTTLSQNVISMILFLRIDTRLTGESETEQWVRNWKRFAKKVSVETSDKILPHLMGLAIGIARNDDFLIAFCGRKVKKELLSQGINVRAALGELESVVIFMKAAASKNRVTAKVEQLFDPAGDVDED